VRRERRDVSGFLAGSFSETHLGSSCRGLSAASQHHRAAILSVLPPIYVLLRPYHCAVAALNRLFTAVLTRNAHAAETTRQRMGYDKAATSHCNESARSREVFLWATISISVAAFAEIAECQPCKRPQSINPRQDESQQSAGAS
jgi:hypothetical protein